MEEITAMNYPRTILYLLLFVVFISCSKEEGKHLFILSGQSNMVRLNVAESFTPLLDKAFGKEHIIVVKEAKGSQPIWKWYKDWESPTNFQPKKKGILYDRLLQKIDTAIKGKKITTVSFIWMQGERDARKEFGGIYEQSLLGLYQQLSQDLKRNDINFVIGRLSDFDMNNEKYSHWTKVRKAQVTIGNSNPRFAWVNTDDLNDGIDRRGKEIKNDLHMSAIGYKILGKRFAEKAVELIKKNYENEE